LESLGALWTEKKANLKNSGEFQQFIKKMQREWIIETGIIERLFVSVLVAFISILSLALCKKDYPTCLKY
jgi:hypothetical protein